LVASVPPVEAPMKMIFSVDSRPRLETTGAAAARGAPAAAGAGDASLRTCARAAVRTFSVI
jgi:hypothetical protein